MKAVGCGPITRLANVVSSSAAGLVYCRDSWNAGRDLTTEEQRFGVLVRLRDLAAMDPSLSCGPDAATISSLEAVVRVQTADAQLSEVNAVGDGAFLERAPKGRWRKISRAKTLLIEDTADSFSDPAKTFTPRIQSYGEYVRRVGRLPQGKPLLRFVMFRDGYSLESVRHRLHYELGIPEEAVFLHRPPGGSFGSMTQFGVAVGVTHEQLPHASRHYNVHPLIFDNRGYHSLDSLAQLSAPPQMHLHRIMLRCVDADEEAVRQRLQLLHSAGFINYFGVEECGIGSNTRFDLAAFSHGNQLHRAVGGLLQTMAEASAFHHQPYLSYVNSEEGTAAGAVKEWLRLCEQAKLPRRTRDVLNALYRYHLPSNNSESHAVTMQDVWDASNVGSQAEHSAAAFVWNAMASQRLLSFGSRPVKGDLVLRNGADGSPEIGEIANGSEAALCSLEDVVLPVPGRHSAGVRYPSHSVNEALFARFADKHKLSFLYSSTPTELQPTPPLAPPIDVLYRRLSRRPRQLQAAVLHDPSSCAAMKHDYFLMQEHQPTESWSMDFERRVREPSPFNVSERFSERMRQIQTHRHGAHTVAVSFLLPAESSPWVALREVFDLRYGTFHDLYGVF